MKERPIQEYYDKAQELATNTQCLYYYREYVARGMQYQEAVTKQVMIDKACEWLKEQTLQEFPGAPHERIFDDYDIREFRKSMED